MAQQVDITALKNRIANGDVNALNELYRCYYRKLKLYGTQFSPKLISLSVEDLIQDLFLWIAKNHKQLNEVDNLEVYLFSALKRNIYQDIHKGQSRKNLLVLYSNSAQTKSHETSEESKIIDSENRHLDKQLVHRLLAHLPDKQREVIYLRNYVNMSYKEIGEVMNLSEQIVRNYSYRAMQSLKSKSTPDSYIQEG